SDLASGARHEPYAFRGPYHRETIFDRTKLSHPGMKFVNRGPIIGGCQEHGRAFASRFSDEVREIHVVANCQTNYSPRGLKISRFDIPVWRGRGFESINWP